MALELFPQRSIFRDIPKVVDSLDAWLKRRVLILEVVPVHSLEEWMDFDFCCPPGSQSIHEVLVE
jgi:hypothetical protein